MMHTIVFTGIYATLLSLLMATGVQAQLNARPPRYHAAEIAATQPWYTATHTFAQTYYVAPNESGASNTACNGSSPYNAGSGNCPFASLAATPIGLLAGTGGWAVYLRSGTYNVTSAIGIVLNCNGTASTPCLFGGYQNEWPRIQGGINTTDTIIRLNGDFLILQGLEIVGTLTSPITAASHYVVAVAGDDMVVRRNILRNASDCFKTLVNGDRGFYYGNMMEFCTNNGTDQYSGDQWIVRSNYVNRCGGNGLLHKSGVNGGVSSYNIVSCPEGTIAKAGIRMGGDAGDETSFETGVAHCTDCVAYGNLVRSHPFGCLFALGCVNCEFSYNRCETVGGGVQVEDGGSLDNPGVTTSLLVSHNRIVDASSDLMYRMFDGTQAQAFTSEYNLYGGIVAGTNAFCIDPTCATFAAWKTATGTDTTSEIR